MSSRVGKVAVVAGLVALGVTEGNEVLAAERGSEPDVTQSGRTNAKKAARPAADAGLVATLPGFQMLPDGSSRLFVALTKTAEVTEKRDARALTYVIHGAHVTIRNNENALVTVHFNTPVTRARLLPVRGDVVFSVELRADSAAVWRQVNADDGTSMLQIDFPKGSFLPANEMDPSGAVATDPNVDPPLPRPADATEPPRSHHHHSGGGHGTPHGPPTTPTPGT